MKMRSQSNKQTQRYVVGKKKSSRELRAMVLKLLKQLTELETVIDKYSEEDLNKLFGGGKAKLTNKSLALFEKELGRLGDSLGWDKVPTEFAGKIMRLRQIVNIEYESRFMDKEE